MASAAEMTLHVELSGLDRDLLERTCENLEWYRKHLQEQAQMMQVEQEARVRREKERKVLFGEQVREQIV